MNIAKASIAFTVRLLVIVLVFLCVVLIYSPPDDDAQWTCSAGIDEPTYTAYGRVPPHMDCERSR